LRSIRASIEVFAAELERMDREGDYEEPERVVRQGAFAWIGEHGHPHVA
jgi:hypothetical protein